MKPLTKNQKIILAAVIIIFLVVGGIIYWLGLPKEKKMEVPFSEEKIIPEEEPQEIFNLGAEILEVNIKGNYLIAKPLDKEKEIKVVLREETEIVQLEFPFDPKSPPLAKTFTFKEIPIKIEDLKVGAQILITTGVNITTGENPFNYINQIQVMP